MYRIAYATHIIGGVGGTERAAYSIAHTLHDEHIDLYIERNLGGRFGELPASVRIMPRSRWREPGRNRLHLEPVYRFTRPLRRRFNESYDLLLQFLPGPIVPQILDARVRALVPAGNTFGEVARHFDVIMMEAPANVELTDSSVRKYVLAPPLFAMAEVGEIPSGLPSEFFLTVMNPYGPVKGLDALMAFAAVTPLPIIWCLSEKSVSAARGLDLDDVPSSIQIIRDPSQEVLRGLYETTSGYICFSKSEGFGWALADALLYGSPIVSRKTGVLTLADIDLTGVALIQDDDEILDGIARLPRSSVTRDVDVLSPSSYRARFHQFMKEMLG